MKSAVEQALKYIETCLAKGENIDDILERISPDTYDAIIDAGVDFDKLQIGSEGIKAVREMTKAPRPTFEKGYNKKYPKEIQDLYNGLVDYLQDNGCGIFPMEKCNFRNLKFIDPHGTIREIVLSTPRKDLPDPETAKYKN